MWTNTHTQHTQMSCLVLPHALVLQTSIVTTRWQPFWKHCTAHGEEPDTEWVGGCLDMVEWMAGASEAEQLWGERKMVEWVRGVTRGLCDYITYNYLMCWLVFHRELTSALLGGSSILYQSGGETTPPTVDPAGTCSNYRVYSCIASHAASERVSSNHDSLKRFVLLSSGAKLHDKQYFVSLIHRTIWMVILTWFIRNNNGR